MENKQNTHGGARPGSGPKRHDNVKKYVGYGYHGGGRKATGIKRVSICISGQPEQIGELKKMAAQEEKTVSAFILEKTGVGGIK